jgi:hypothetical protein
MGNAETNNNAPRSGQNRLLIFLLAFAAISSLVKDLDRLHTLTSNIHGLAVSLMPISSTDGASDKVPDTCPLTLAQTRTTEQEGQVKGDQALAGIYGGVTAEPARRVDLEAWARKGPRNNSVRVDLSGAPQVAATARPANSPVSVRSLTARINSRALNSSISLATLGHARARVLNREIKNQLANANWNDEFEFKVVNGRVDLHLPTPPGIELYTFDGDMSDLPNEVNRASRRHLKSPLGYDGRELLLKVQSGSVRFKKA